jgi:hypothetical protein
MFNKEIDGEGVVWLQLTQKSMKSWAAVMKVSNLQVP